VTFRFFASAREAAGAPELVVPAGRVCDTLDLLRRTHSPRFVAVLAVSSLLCDGSRLDPDSGQDLPPGATVEVLPPFAGG
jgi:molybdopterin converting factor small subunit